MTLRRDAQSRDPHAIALVDREGLGLLDVGDIVRAEGETPRNDDAVLGDLKLDALGVVVGFGETPTITSDGGDESAVGNHMSNVHDAGDLEKAATSQGGEA